MTVTLTDLRSVRRAFETHHPNAQHRAQWLRTRIVLELDPLAKHVTEKLDHGDDWLAFAGERDWTFVEGRLTTPLDQAEVCRYDALVTYGRVLELQAMLEQVDGLLQEDGAKDVEGPTVDFIRKVGRGRGDPLLRLVALHRLSDEDLWSGREIASIIRHVTSFIDAGAMRLPVKSPEMPSEDAVARRSAAETAEWYACLHAYVYRPWCERTGRRDRDLIHGLVHDGVALETLRARYRMSYGTALQRVKDGLKEYRAIRRGWLKSRDAAGSEEDARSQPLPAR
jgi:hypothetical protein